MNTHFTASSSSATAASHYSKPCLQDARPEQQVQVFGRYACLNTYCDKTFSKWTVNLHHIQRDHEPGEALSKTTQQLSLADQDSSDKLKKPGFQGTKSTSRKKNVGILNEMSLSQSKAAWLSGGQKEKIKIAFNHYLLCPQTGCHMITAVTLQYHNHMINVHKKTSETVDYGQGALEAHSYLRQQPWAEVDETITSEMIAKAGEDRIAERESHRAARTKHRSAVRTKRERGRRNRACQRFVDNS